MNRHHLTRRIKKTIVNLEALVFRIESMGPVVDKTLIQLEVLTAISLLTDGLREDV